MAKKQDETSVENVLVKPYPIDAVARIAEMLVHFMGQGMTIDGAKRQVIMRLKNAQEIVEELNKSETV